MKKKAEKTAIVIVAVVAAALIAVFFNRSKIIVYLSEKSINSGNYSAAEQLLEYDKSVYASDLKRYIELRHDIKTRYPALLREFDLQTISGWREESGSLAQSGIKNTSIAAQIKKIYAGTGLIISADSAYSQIENDVDSLLDVFSEYNRLHIQKNGENSVFTLREEYSKLNKWQTSLDNISNFAEAVPDYEGVYLLSYLIKEAQSEIVQLKNEMDSVSAAGHGLDENVHYSDNTARNFPEINNGNGTVISFRNKADFKKYLLAGIRSRLVSTQLVAYYYDSEER